MKLADVLILSLALAFSIIGIHQSMTVGIGGSYFIFMFAAGLLFWFQLRRNKRLEAEKEQSARPKQKKKQR
ncbi:hypothetical protein [Algoriphagus litoralis]|uniref:hypothetical protein n=1 Tax=Algoriphagus litoralis TaxID=2202829 RepID=UPI000DB93B0C|nr:hypothetical protein [Algoriphagus litoralis]